MSKNQTPVRRVLYCGDGDMTSAAGYLGGLMTLWGWSFEHIPDDQDLDETAVNRGNLSLIILSDYSARHVSTSCHLAIQKAVREGTGLLMIGGWTSYRGRDGLWGGTPVGDLLPVLISVDDDRVNCDQATVVRATQPHPATAGLPWTDRPPAIGGFNRVTVKPDATTLLECQQFSVRVHKEGVEFTATNSDVLLAVGAYGRGRTAAFTTDVAPHWVGPLIDWGTGRVTSRPPGGTAREIGELYANFLQQLLSWVQKPDKQGNLQTATSVDGRPRPGFPATPEAGSRP